VPPIGGLGLVVARGAVAQGLLSRAAPVLPDDDGVEEALFV
jgi:hypothetical protein